MRRVAQLFKELRRIEREFVVSMGKRLEVELLTGGSIEISGWPKECVSVVARLGGWNWRNCAIKFDESASGLRISSSSAGNHQLIDPFIALEIKVPNRFDINIISRGGDLELDGISGLFEGVTNGGSLSLTNLKGKLNLKTLGGDITLTSSEVSGEVHTNGGQVFIKDVIGGVKGFSQAGHVRYSNSRERDEDELAQELSISSMGGPVGIETAPSGANLATMGGDIYVGSAALYVKARTMAGNIQVNAIDGWAHATTMFGNIAVTMMGDPEKGNRDVILNSNGGDISLTLPAELSMTVYLSLAQTINNLNHYSITSDFDLVQEGPGELFYHDGTPRRYTIGSGSFAGGKNKITVKTINGNIFFKKGS
jgi:DUF4097 and DUF4098 domain-containing protein YvlB